MTDASPSFSILEFAVAIEGMAMMRRWPVDDEQVRARMAELRDLLARGDEPALARRIAVHVHDVPSGYERWAAQYDGPNPAIALEERCMHEVLGRRPVGDALDVGCGTGRQAAFLASAGHTVTGVDATPAMLAVAREKLPASTFHLGTFEHLPLADGSVDLVVCSLALTHTKDLGPAIAEMARVLRPGGGLVISDIHPDAVEFGAGAVFPGDEGALSLVRNERHPLGTYVKAARSAGLTVEECHELEIGEAELRMSPVWTLVPDAVRQAESGLHFIVIWRFAKA